MTKTFLPSVKEVETTRKWHHIDATGQTLGRLATQIAVLLMGKHKRTYTPHMDCGDFVVVTNAGKVKLTGNKMEQKVYFSHSGYAKGAKETPVKRVLEKNPTRVLELAVKRMLDENKLRAPRMKRLRLFAGEEHSFTERFGK
ncbi:MAG: 50S ribosomal protein L13 [Elusimicrobiaceae bacterium]|jgi:large subunit ribosomal protein L13|uniref:Large ribosomal subunit protein uL13 n=1 Tax=Candidatus Avelusimicrobium gallicola TaxID=2562704 RepID=A0A928DPP5_9BACT|nr:50S ribosomal protein L13 [Elusimicrobium sp.]MBQ9971381.1 50S ribosomal protein L13 [Elusimicrobiaceae bacterium]